MYQDRLWTNIVNSFLRAVLTLKNNQCTKTGSGQTWEKVEGKGRGGVSLQARAEAEKKAVPAAGGGLKKPGGSGFKLAAAVRHVPPCQEAHEISSACHALIPECDSRTSACPPRAHRHPVTSASTNLAAIIMTRVSKPHAHVISCQRGISSAYRALTSACHAMLTS
eukprot:COSAG06_NODE_541_length_14471_cov_35.139229_19_plen_166_part_00